MRSEAGICGEDTNFSLSQGNLNLQREAVSRTFLGGFMTQNDGPIQMLGT